MVTITPEEREILSMAAKIQARIRMEKVSPEKRLAIAKRANKASQRPLKIKRLARRVKSEVGR